jgi:putative membrane protein
MSPALPKKFAFTCALLLSMGTATAFAQNTTHSDSAHSTSSTTGTASTNHAEAMDPEDFVDNASAKGIAEIEAAKLALGKSQSQDVKTFAQMMIDDHTKMNEQLKQLAQQKKLEVADNAQLMDMAKAMILHVRDESFDAAYANNQVVAHEQTIELFRNEANTSKDPELKALAKTALPKLEAHLEHAKTLQSKYAKKQ